MDEAPETDVFNYANYALGYAAFGGEQYRKAAHYFEKFLKGDEKDQNTINDAVTRLADSYLPLAGPHDGEPALVGGLVDVPASRFLRPVSKNAPLERLRLWRITSAMETAARRRRLFHLWWHPHNFGVQLEANLRFLETILARFRALRERHGMESLSMSEAARRGAGPRAEARA